MKQTDLQSMLRTLDKLGIYVLTTKDLRVHFPQESESGFQAALARHVKSGILENPCRGIYINPNANSKDSRTLERIAKTLRRNNFSYISLESLLSESGAISQIPVNLLTVMTTGRSQKYKTPYGDIEFIHTKKPVSYILKNTVQSESRPIRLASVDMAIEDLKHVGRNMHLVNKGQH